MSVSEERAGTLSLETILLYDTFKQNVSHQIFPNTNFCVIVSNLQKRILMG